MPLDDELLELEDELLDALALLFAGLTLSDPPPPPPQAASKVRTVSGRMRWANTSGRTGKGAGMTGSARKARIVAQVLQYFTLHPASSVGQTGNAAAIKPSSESRP